MNYTESSRINWDNIVYQCISISQWRLILFFIEISLTALWDMALLRIFFIFELMTITEVCDESAP